MLTRATILGVSGLEKLAARDTMTKKRTLMFEFARTEQILPAPKMSLDSVPLLPDSAHEKLEVMMMMKKLMFEFEMDVPRLGDGREIHSILPLFLVQCHFVEEADMIRTMNWILEVGGLATLQS